MWAVGISAQERFTQSIQMQCDRRHDGQSVRPHGSEAHKQKPKQGKAAVLPTLIFLTVLWL